MYILFNYLLEGDKGPPAEINHFSVEDLLNIYKI